MPIKLADVIENLERQLPVVDPRSRSVHGLFLGSAGASSVVQLEPQYSSSVFQGVKTENATAVAYSTTAGSIAQIDGANPLLLTDRGGIITAYDDVSSRLHAYMLKSVVDGDNSTTAANRSSADKFQELVSQFDVYSEIAPGDVQAAINSGDQVWFAAYDSGDKRQYKISASNLVALLASVLAQDAITNGLLDVTSAGGSGLIGDLNGDGVVGSGDLLALLGLFDSGTASQSFETELIYLTGDSTSAVTTLSGNGMIAGTGTDDDYVLADFDTWSFGASATTQTDQLYGWASASAPSLNSTGNFSLNGMTLASMTTVPILSLWLGKDFQVDVQVAVQPNYTFESVNIYLYVEVEFETGVTKDQLYLIGKLGYGGAVWPNNIGTYSFFSCSFDSSMIANSSNQNADVNQPGVSRVFKDENDNVWQGGDTTIYSSGSTVNVGMDQPWNLGWDENPTGTENYITNITHRVLANSFTDSDSLWYVDGLIVRTTAADI